MAPSPRAAPACPSSVVDLAVRVVVVVLLAQPDENPLDFLLARQAATRHVPGDFLPSRHGRYRAGECQPRGRLAVRFALLLALALTVASGYADAQQRQRPSQPPSPSTTQRQQPNQAEGTNTQQNRDAEPRGTEDKPVVVKVLPAEKTAAERTQETQDRSDKASADWWMVRLTAALAVVGVLQFLALIGQAIVFGIQARRLSESVDLTRTVADRQEHDMAESIAEASRAAVAMERVAASLAETAGLTRDNHQLLREMQERQAHISSLQLRAYVSARFANIVPQNDAIGIRFEPRMMLINTGHTPAYNVRHRMAADVQPFPLPSDFAFPLPDFHPEAGAGTMGPQQNFIVSGVAPRLYNAQEVAAIKNGTAIRLYAWGEILYDDAFRVEHRTNFSVSFGWLNDKEIMSFNTRRRNDAT